MTASGIRPDLGSRIGSLLLSGALHLAAGLALFLASDQGIPRRGPAGAGGSDVLVVELIALDRPAGAPGDSMVDRNGPASTETAPPVPVAQGSRDIPPVPTASGGAAREAAAAGAEKVDTRRMTDLPSSEVLAYRQRLESHLARYRIYPANARATGRQGVVTVYFTMTRDGHVTDLWVEASSGVSDLDTEALAAILRAQPLPAFPQSWPGRLDVSLPVSFRLG